MRQQPPPRSMLEQALAYAAAGVPVFPCAPAGKTPLTRNGFHDATTDHDKIRRWWAAHPNANIATPTGAPGFDALDVDVRADGAGWPAFIRAKHAGLLDGWVRAVRTPSGGLHLHYPGTDQRNGTLPGQHLDFRGAGGYVLLPPSRVQTESYTGSYRLLRSQLGNAKPLDWAAVLRLLQPVVPVRQPAVTRRGDPIGRLAAHVAGQAEGNRDNALFWAACRAAEARVVDVRPLVDAAIQAGLLERQARRTVRSAYDTVARQGVTFRAPAAALHQPGPAR